ncbi:hypothetical protein BN000_03390 [Neobacillus massiliamazoniensis]|uniref:Uncharacterized protein n=2 Tax=Neobacillus massiliamazoniensis TaxID=1499688 RepID=A0A0U1NZZ3_9BACI|nr:hypothetical protein BN000_03390 [Neobacillus massiliamazoniensis]
MDIEKFHNKLSSKTYKNTYIKRIVHWGENGFFLKRKTKNNFEITYHKAYFKDFTIIDICVVLIEDGIQITAKPSSDLNNSYNLDGKRFDLIVNLLNEILY